MKYRGQNLPLSTPLSLGDLLPDTDGYMTYEGSLTQPGCWESVTWIVLNRPIYLGRRELLVLRDVKQGDKQEPKGPIGANVRPRQDLNGRSVRTNIAFDDEDKVRVNGDGKKCPDVSKDRFYEANDLY